MFQIVRTSLLSLGFVAGSLSLAAAEADYRETVVHDTTTNVEIDLNSSTVLCSAADYGALFLKIGMPELAGITLLDHQNAGAGAPCVAAGICAPGNEPKDLIDPAHPTEIVPINVKAVRFDVVDKAAGTCETSLIERVHLVVRGIEFNHERQVELVSRKAADCTSGTSLFGEETGSGSGSSSGKTDESGKVDETEPGGGCSAGGGAGSAMAFVMLGAVAAFRRRRAAR
jgi:uncharacterized protein (TIGR03382 family)